MKHLFAWGLLGSVLGLGACEQDKYILDSYSTMRYDVLGLTSPTDTMALHTVDFVSAREGFIGGAGGAFFATNDGGQTWAARPEPALGAIHKLLFSTASTGWAGTDGGLYRTVDGGRTWQSVTIYDSRIRPDPPVYDIQFVTPQVGYAVGSYGSINKTTNGGSTWQPVLRDNYTRFTFRGVSFTAADSGTVVGEQLARWTTVDGGRTWNQLNESTGRSNTTHFDVLRFSDRGASDRNYLLAGASGFESYLASDGGYGLRPNEPVLGPVYGLATFGPAGPVVAVGERTVIRRHPEYSEGSPWVNVHAPDGTSLGKGARFEAADFADAATFFAVGPHGTVYRFHYQ